MSALRSIRRVPLSPLSILLALGAVGACSDPATGPSKEVDDSAAPVSAAVVSSSGSGIDPYSLLQLQVLASFTINNVAAANPTYCLFDNRGFHKLRMMTEAGIPFWPTGSQSQEVVWFRAHYYERWGGLNQSNSLGWSDWFYTILAPGQTSTAVWYLYRTPGGLGSWFEDRRISPDYGASVYADYEYYWNQNGTTVHNQVVRPTHIASQGFAVGGNSCLVSPTGGVVTSSGNTTGNLLYGLSNLPNPF